MDEQLPHGIGDFIPSTEAAKMYAVTNDYVARLCRQGRLRGSLEGRVWMVERTSLSEFFSGMPGVSGHAPLTQISSRDAARQYRVTNDYITRLCRQGKISGALEGTMWMVDPHSLHQFFAKRGRQPIKEVPQTQRPIVYIQNSAIPASSASASVAVASSIGRRSLIFAGTLAAVFILLTGSTAMMNASPEGRSMTASLGQIPLYQTLSHFLDLSWLFGQPAQPPQVAVQTQTHPPTPAPAVQPTPATLPQETINNNYTYNDTYYNSTIQNPGDVSEAELETKLNSLASSLQVQTTPTLMPSSGGLANVVALSQNIDQLTGTHLSNITISGVSGLQPSDIPALPYLAVSGGTLTGAIIDSDTATSSFEGPVSFASLEVATATQATSTFGGGINLTGGCLEVNGTCLGNAAGNPGGSDSEVQFNDNGVFNGAPSFTFSTSSDTLTVSDTEVIDATTTNASTTNLYVSGTIGLGTALAVSSGGTGTSSAPSYGELLVGDGNGGYSLLATSSLGIAGGSGGGSSNVSTSSQNTWSALQLFAGNASTTELSVFNSAYFGATATSTFNGSGQLTLAGLTSSLLGVNASGQVVATTTIGSNVLSVPFNSLLAGNGSGQLIATTSIGTNYLSGTLGTINGTGFSVGGTINITAASSTLLANSNTWTGFQQFSNASSTLTTLDATWFSGLNNDILSTNSSGQVVATSSIGTNYLTGALGTINGTPFNVGGSITVSSASSTLLANNNTFSGSSIFSNLLTLTNGLLANSSSTLQNFTGVNATTSQATTTSFAITSLSNALLGVNANGSVVATSTIGTSLLSGELGTINGQLLTAGGTINITAASSTLLASNNTFTGTDTFNNTIAGSINGNAGTATILQTARNINGVSFDGSADILINAASSTLLTDSNSWTKLQSFVNASSTLTTLGVTWFNGLNNDILSTNSSGQVVATTSIGTNYLTGVLGTINGTSFSIGSSIAVSSASTTLLGDNNTFSGSDIFSNLLTLSGGLTAYASSTIGDGSTGLTVNGSATTTGNAYFGQAVSASGLVYPGNGSGSQSANYLSGNTTGIGIDTANAQWPFNVVAAGGGLGGGSTAFTNSAFLQDQSNYRGIELGYDTSGEIGVVSGASDGSPSSIAFWNYNGSGWQEDARIQGSTGDLGIGTTTPGSILSVQGVGNFVANATSTLYNGLDVTGGCVAVNGTCIGSSSASSTLLGDNNTFSGADTFSRLLTLTDGFVANASSTLQNFTALNATTSQATTTNFAITSLANSLLGVNASGTVVATTSIGTNLLTGALGTINGTGFSIGGSINITAASSTLLSNNNSWTGLQQFANASSTLTTLGTTWFNGLTNDILSTNGSGQVVATSSIGTNYLVGALGSINGQTLNVGGSITFTTASSSLLADNNTFSGTNIFSNLLTLNGGFLANASSTFQNFTGVNATTSQATTTNFAITSLANSLLGVNANGTVVATTTIGSNLLSASGVTPGSYTTANVTVNTQGIITSISNGSGIAASSTLLTDNNTWTGLQQFSNASSTLTTLGTTWFNGLTNDLLSTNASGQVVATTSIGTNYLTGALGSINGTPFSVGGSITVSSASTTLLGDNNTFSGNDTFKLLNLSATSSSLLSTNASGQVVATTSIGTNYLTGTLATVNSTAITAGGTFTITAASSTLLANNNAFSGSNIFSSLLTLTNGFLANASSTLQNFTGVNATTSQATTTSFAITKLSNALLGVNANGSVVATTTIGSNLLSVPSNSLLAGNGSGQLIASTTIGWNLLKGPASSIFAFDASGNPTATTSIGTNYITGTLGTINGTGFSIGGNINITAASSTLLANNNSWTGLQQFANASSTLTTLGTTWFNGLPNDLLSTNASGQVVATSSIGTNYLTGTLGTINGTPLSVGGTINIAAASSTLLANNNTFSGANLFSGNATLTNATTSSFAITNLANSLLGVNASGSVIATTTIGSNLLSASGVTPGSYVTANVTVNTQGIITSISNGSGIAASSTLLSDNNTFSGSDTFKLLNLSATSSSLLSTNASGEVIATTSIGTNYLIGTLGTINGQALTAGGSVTVAAASSTLLANNNTFSGSDIFSNLLTLSNGLLGYGSSTIGNGNASGGLTINGNATTTGLFDLTIPSSAPFANSYSEIALNDLPFITATTSSTVINDLAIGIDAFANGNSVNNVGDNTAIGNYAVAAANTDTNTIIGANASSTQNGGVVIGANAYNSGPNGIAIGSGVKNSATDGTVIGNGNAISNSGLISMGYSSSASAQNAMAFGWGVGASLANQIVFGSRGSATATPSLQLVGSTAVFTGEPLFNVATEWLPATVNTATREGGVILSTYDYTGAREFLRAETTGSSVVTSFNGGNVGIGTTSPIATLTISDNTENASTNAFLISSSTAGATTTLFSISNTGSTTAANGFNITAGCFALNGTCIGSSAASSTLLADNNTFSGTNFFTGSTTLTNATTTNFAITNLANSLLGVNASGSVVATTTIGINYLSADTISGVTLGQNLSNATFNNGGAGASSGSTFDGGSALTVSYNTLGAQVAGTYLTGLGNYATTTGTALSLSTSTANFQGATFGQTIVASANGLLFTPTITGTLAAASSTLLANNNTFSGINIFSNLLTLNGGFLAGASSTLQNFTALNATTSQATTTSFAITSLANSLLGVNANGSVVATTTIGSNLLSASGVTPGSYITANVTVNTQGIITSISSGSGTAASSTLLGDNNTFTGSNTFKLLNLSATTSSLLATNASGEVIATTSIGTNLLTGTLGTVNGQPLTAGGSVTVTAASSTLLTNNNSWTGLQTFANASSTLTTLGTTWFSGLPNDILSTNGNGQVVATSSIGTNYLTGALGTINGTPFSVGGSISVAAASTTLLGDNNTFTGNNTFKLLNLSATSSSLLATNASGEVVATTTIGINYLSADTISGVTLGNNLSNVTFNNGGAGASSGQTYNGSSATTISYNTLGAQAAGTYLTGLGNYSTTTGTAISFSTTTQSFQGATFGQTITVSPSGLLFTPTVTGTLSAASSTLLSNNNSWTGLNTFTNASSTLTTLGTTWFNGLNNDILSTNGSGQVVATTSIGTNYLTGALGTINGQPLSVGGSITVASTTLLANNNTFSGSNIFSNLLTLTNGFLANASSTLQNFTGVNATTSQATTTNFAITNLANALLGVNANGSVVATTSIGSNLLNVPANSLLAGNGSGQIIASTTIGWNLLKGPASSIFAFDASGNPTATTSIGTNYLTGALATINGVPFSVGSSITVASTTLLANNNTFSGNDIFSNLLVLNGGLTAYASSTIGNGTQAGGLTINGGATTTLNAYFASSLTVGTTTPFAALSVQGASSAAAGSGAQTAFSVFGGTGSTTGAGGAIALTAGNGGTSGSGGNVTLTGGIGTFATLATAGANLVVGGGTTGGGGVTITGGTARSGGGFSFTGGDAQASIGAAGGFTVNAGNNYQGIGGDIAFTSGIGGTVRGGNLSLTAGSAPSAGGSVSLTTGSATSSGSGGSFALTGGGAGAASQGGSFNFTGGTGSTTGKGGDFTILGGTGGNSAGSRGGNILLDAGAKGISGAFGNILLSTINTAGDVGIGTTSPFADLSIFANNGSTNTTLFAIGSSTAGATTTLFSISNTGSTTIANGINIATGCFAVNGTCIGSTAASSTLLGDNNTFTGNDIFKLLNLSATSSSLLATNASGEVVATTTIGSNLLSVPANSLLSGNGSGQLIASTTIGWNLLKGPASSIFAFDASGNPTATTSIGTNYITGVLGNINGAPFSVGGSITVSSTTLLANNNTFSGNNVFSNLLTLNGGFLAGASSTLENFTGVNATTSQATTTSFAITKLSNALLGVNANGTVVSTTTIGSNLLSVPANSLLAGNGSGQLIASTTIGWNLLKGPASSIFAFDASGNPTATTSIGTNYLTGALATINGVPFSVGSSITVASTTLLANNNTFSGTNVFANTTFTNATTSSFAITNLANSLLGVNASGSVVATTTIGWNLLKGPASSIFAFDASGNPIATTSIGTNYLTGVLGNVNGAPFSVGGSITVSSTTLLSNNNTFSGNNIFSNLLTLNGGLTAFASSTIGNSTQAGGLTISGGATTTLGLNIASSTLGLYLNGVATVEGSTTRNNFYFAGATTSAQNNGSYNYAIGQYALANATSSSVTDNFAVGFEALMGSTTVQNSSTGNTAIGSFALTSNTSGVYNNALGYDALGSNTTGISNNALGYDALGSNTTGSNNNGFGQYAMLFNTTGSDNNALGYSSLRLNTTGNNNNAFGQGALLFNTTGTNNTAIGYQAGFNVSTGYSNILLGDDSTGNAGPTSGSANIGIGPNVFFADSTANSQLNIGNFLFGTLPATTTAFTLPTSGAIGIGTSSPFAEFAIGANNGSTNTTLFAIGSSTASATTTLFSISNIGHAALGNAALQDQYPLWSQDENSVGGSKPSILDIADVVSGDLSSDNGYNDINLASQYVSTGGELTLTPLEVDDEIASTSSAHTGTFMGIRIFPVDEGTGGADNFTGGTFQPQSVDSGETDYMAGVGVYPIYFGTGLVDELQGGDFEPVLSSGSANNVIGVNSSVAVRNATVSNSIVGGAFGVDNEATGSVPLVAALTTNLSTTGDASSTVGLMVGPTSFEPGITDENAGISIADQTSDEFGGTIGQNFQLISLATNPFAIVAGNGNVGIGTTSPTALLSLDNNDGSTATTLFAIASTTSGVTTSLFSISNTGSTTAANGFNLTAGCFAVNGTCLGSSSASSTLLANNNTFSGNDTFKLLNLSATSSSLLATNASGEVIATTSIGSNLLSVPSNSVLAGNGSGQLIASTTIGWNLLKGPASSIFAFDASGNPTATTSIGTNYLTGPLGTVNGTSFSVGGSLTVASTTLLANNNTFSGNDIFSNLLTLTNGFLANASSTLQNFTALNATTSQATTTSFAITRLSNALLGVNANGTVVSTTTIGTDLLTGALATINGTPLSVGSSITVSSTTLLANNNTFSGNNIFSSLLTLTNGFLANASSTLQNFTGKNATTSQATTTNFAITGLANALLGVNANGSVVSTTTIGTDLLTGALATINGTPLSVGGSITVASTTLLANNNTFSGTNIFSNLLTLSNGFLAGASSTLQNFTGVNATTSQATTTSFAITSLANSLLGVNANGTIVSTTTIGTDLLTGALATINGTPLSVGGSITVASTTLLANNNTFSGNDVFLNLLGLNGGLTAYASSTIGNGIQAGGLTINGGATTTGNAYFQNLVGIGTNAPVNTLDIVNQGSGTSANAGFGLLATPAIGSVTTSGTTAVNAATSTFAPTASFSLSTSLTNRGNLSNSNLTTSLSGLTLGNLTGTARNLITSSAGNFSITGSPVFNNTGGGSGANTLNPQGISSSVFVTPVNTAGTTNNFNPVAGSFSESSVETGLASGIGKAINASELGLFWSPSSSAYGGSFTNNATASTSYGIYISQGSSASANTAYGLRIDGPATTNPNDFSFYSSGTAPSYFAGNLGIGTTTPGSLLSLDNGSNSISFSLATSTFNTTGGINLAHGCFAIGGTCIGAGGSSASSTLLANNNTFSGNDIFSNLLTLNGGFLAPASSTVGNGTQAGGLTINGTATTTKIVAPLSTALSVQGGFDSGGGGGNVTVAGGDTNTSSSGGGSLTLRGGNAEGSNQAGGSVLIQSGAGAILPSGTITFDIGAAQEAIINTSGNFGIGTTSPGSLLSLAGTSGIVASTTATSTFVGGGINLVTASGNTGCFAVNGTCLSSGASFGYLFPSNATTTGLLLLASTTIGNGAQAGGLTINGGATTTLNAYFASNIGIGTSTPWAQLSLATPSGATGSRTELFAIASSSLSGTATSTLLSFNNKGQLAIGPNISAVSSSTQFSVLAGTSTISMASSTEAGLSSAYAAYVQGRYAYVASHGNNSLVTFDISNPASPQEVSTTSTGLSGPYGVYVSGHYAYLASNGNNSLVTFDISNPASPQEVSTISTGLSGPYGVYVSGRYAYVASSGNNALVVFDISNPASPQEVSSILTGLSFPQSVYVQGRYAYVISNGNNSLVTFDISNPASPQEVGSSSTGVSNPQSVYVQGRYAYVASYGNNSLVIFDISNPASPQEAGTISTGLSGPGSVSVQGRYAYVTNNGNGSLTAFDVSNPASPQEAGTISTGLSTPNTIYVSGRYAYVADGTNGLVNFDLGGAYIQQLETGGLETGTLNVRDDLQAVDGEFSGGLTVGQSLQVTGSASILSATSTIGTTANIFNIATASSTTPIFDVLGNGSVGISTSTDSAKFSVQGSGGQIADFANSSGTSVVHIASTGNIGLSSTTPWADVSIENDAADPGFLVANSTNNATEFIVSGSGLTGIGTTTPFWALTVASSTGPQIGLTDGTSGDYAWTLRSISNSFYLATSTAAATSGTPAISISPFGVSGAVGIGTTTNSTHLAVEEGALPNAFMVSNTGSTTPSFWIGGVNQNGDVGVGTSTDIASFSIEPVGGSGQIMDVANNLGTSVFHITSGGSIGIGSTTPDQALAVSGNVDITSGHCFMVAEVCIGYVTKLQSIYATSTAGTSTVQFTGAQNSNPAFSGTTLTLPKNVSYYTVEAWGGGGGGGADTNTTNGTAGGQTCYSQGTVACGGSANIEIAQASGGTQGTNAGAGGAGGAASLGEVNVTGGTGDNGNTNGFGIGGSAYRGGAGGSAGSTGATGNAGEAPGGGGGGGRTTTAGGGGGGAGGYSMNVASTSVSTTSHFTIGAGGNGGTGTDTGGAGGAGGIVITVYATSSPDAAGNDYAEMFPVSNPNVTAGDIVAVDTGTPVSLTYAQEADNLPLAGVVSTAPGQIIGDTTDPGYRPIALSGRVPVNVNLQNGPIAIGDRIAVSSEPGVGMKAGPFDDSIGIALESYDGTGGTVEPDGSVQGSVTVFVTLQQGIDINDIALGLLGNDPSIFNNPFATSNASSTSGTSTAPLDFVGGMLNAFAQRIGGLTFSAGTSTGSSTQELGFSTSTASADGYTSGFLQALFAQFEQWLASAGNGIQNIYTGALNATTGNFKQVNSGTICLTKSDGTQVCVTGDQLASLLAGEPAGSLSGGSSGSGGSSSSGSPIATSSGPILQVNGADPATVDVGASYEDLGAMITGPQQDLNLGVQASVNGATSTAIADVQIDTSQPGTFTITYSATDQSGLTGTITRTVNVVAPDSDNSDNSATSTPSTSSGQASSTPPTSDDASSTASSDATSTTP